MLIPIALGLLAKAPEEREPEPAATDTVAIRSEQLRHVDAPPRLVDVDVGLTTGARFGFGGPGMLFDAEGRADVVVRSWIVLASARYAANAIVPDDAFNGYSYTELGVSAGLGRRAELGKDLLDVTLTPTIVSITAATDQASGGEGDERTVAQVRLTGAVRYVLRGSGSWRFSAIAEGDLAPKELKGPQRLGGQLPALPRWSLGLRLGVMADLL